MRSRISPSVVASRPNRRRFLAQGGSVAALATLTASKSWAVNTAPKKIHVGIVGGNFGLGFFFHEHPDCVVAAVSDLRPERRDALMKTYRCDKSYASLEEMVLDKNIDAIAIFTDAPLHVEHVTKAMNHGKHALSAVPAAFGTIEQAEQLLAIVKKTGLTYMLAETSYYHQATISARKFYQQGKFGDLFYCSAAYQHDGLEALYFENGKRTWRHGLAPMHYPTHTTAQLIGVTGERLTEVVSHGWGDGDPILKDNAYKNPFWNESATFKTNRNHTFEGRVWWKGAHRGCETADWIGSKMSFYGADANGHRPVIINHGNQTEKDSGGFVQNRADMEAYEQPQWWATDLLPKPLRHDSGHQGAHTFLTHEFIDALANSRRPAIDVYEGLAYTVPGIVAHQSSLRSGELLKIPQYDPPARRTD